METSDFAQDIGPSTSQTTVTEVVCAHFLVTFLLLFVNKIMFTKCFFLLQKCFFICKIDAFLLKMCFFFPWKGVFLVLFFAKVHYDPCHLNVCLHTRRVISVYLRPTRNGSHGPYNCNASVRFDPSSLRVSALTSSD